MTTVCQRGDGSGRSINGRVAYGEDGDENHDVHYRWYGVNACVADGNDEGRGVSIAGRRSDEAVVRVGHKAANYGEGDHVKLM